MSEQTARCYDDLAAHYHLLFEDWEASMARQAAALAALLRRECGEAGPIRVFDCACGIGTQALGLAKLGFRVRGCDISAHAVERARQEAAQRSLDVELFVGSMLEPIRVESERFDAVICMDNALPHRDGSDDLVRAALQARSALREGGSLLASIRDYDSLVVDRPVVHGPTFYSDQGKRRIVLQVWDWLDERRYVFHLYITRQIGGAWQTIHCAARYRALLRTELDEALERAGFADIRWIFPAESSFYQPIVVAK